DRDILRNVVRLAEELDLVAHDVQHAALLQAGALILLEEQHRDEDADSRTLADALEIDMDRPVGDRIELHVAGQNPLRLAVEFDVQQAGEEVALLQFLQQVTAFHRDQFRGLLFTVDDPRHATLQSRCAGGPLAGPSSRLCGDNGYVTHDCAPWLNTAPAPCRFRFRRRPPGVPYAETLKLSRTGWRPRSPR